MKSLSFHLVFRKIDDFICSFRLNLSFRILKVRQSEIRILYPVDVNSKAYLNLISKNFQKNVQADCETTYPRNNRMKS